MQPQFVGVFTYQFRALICDCVSTSDNETIDLDEVDNGFGRIWTLLQYLV